MFLSCLLFTLCTSSDCCCWNVELIPNWLLIPVWMTSVCVCVWPFSCLCSINHSILTLYLVLNPYDDPQGYKYISVFLIDNLVRDDIRKEALFQCPKKICSRSPPLYRFPFTGDCFEAITACLFSVNVLKKLQFCPAYDFVRYRIGVSYF